MRTSTPNSFCLSNQQMFLLMIPFNRGAKCDQTAAHIILIGVSGISFCWKLGVITLCEESQKCPYSLTLRTL